jgi:hypothetical protein
LRPFFGINGKLTEGVRIPHDLETRLRHFFQKGSSSRTEA